MSCTMVNGVESDGEKSDGMALDGDYIDKNDDDIGEHFFARPYDIAVKS